jgi:competence protein ComEC
MRTQQMLNRLLLAALFLAAFSWSSSAQPSELDVMYIDVGQADAILVTCPDGKHHVLIDSGDTRYPGSSDSFTNHLLQAFAGQPKHITIVVATHPHQDHIGNMQWVLENFQVDTYIDNGDKGKTATFGRLDKLVNKLVKAGKLKYINGKQNSFEEIDLCPSVEMEIFEPWAEQDLTDINDRSVGVRLAYCTGSGTNTFLFVGDMGQSAENVMLTKFSEQQRKDLSADVLKVGHHGSDTSSTVPFILAVSPRIAVVSCGGAGVGTNAKYKHPRLSTIRNYANWFQIHPPAVHSPRDKVWAYDGTEWREQTRPDGMWLTVQDGTVVITADGAKYQVSKEK